MRISILLYIFLVFLGGVSCRNGQPREDLTQYVDPFIGTAYVGHTHPAAQLPFGMVQVGPDTGTDKWEHCSGYFNEDSSIIGFSHTHLSGTGCPDMGDIMLMPVTGDIAFQRGDEDDTSTGYRSSFSHDSEEARPGYYKVTLDDYAIQVELTATTRTGFHKYTYPSSNQSGIIIDLGHGIGDRPAETSLVVLNDSTIAGKRQSRGFVADHTWYFCIRLSKPANRYRSYVDGIISQETELKGTVTKLHLQFNTENNEEVLVKVALSTVSEENALENMNAELCDWNFENTLRKASNVWNDHLRKITVVPINNEQKISFYTSLYHTLLMPNIITDIDGTYRLPGGKLMTDNTDDKYTNFSLWDTYRATHPFYNILYPERNVRFVESMLTLFEQRNMLCTNEYGQNETWCMIGNHAVPVIVEAYLKNILTHKQELAADAVFTSLTRPHEKSDWETYDRYGYYPFDVLGVESVSRTLEHCYDDHCAALFAAHVGNDTLYRFFAKRADNYKNLFDKQTRLMRAKDSEGRWRTPFDPFLLSHAGTSDGDYTEGNAWQYTWHVQHAIPDLVKRMGGEDAFEAKLDSFFLMKDLSLGGGFHGDVTGLIGQYAHGNEPSHHVVYLYNYTKAPHKTQKLIRDIFDRFYFPRRDGLSGNDDCGQMSAWYIFSALGFYPVDPVSGQYVMGAPQVHEMKLHLPNGKVFEMKAHNLSEKNKYVRSVKLNGKNTESFIITYDQIKNGGNLEFEMGDLLIRKTDAD